MRRYTKVAGMTGCPTPLCGSFNEPLGDAAVRGM